MIEVDTVKAPIYWASYLINGDASGMEDHEIAECDAWSDSLDGWYVVDCTDDQDFGTFYFKVARRWLGCDLATYTIHHT
jgi:hypothetical protein